MTPALAAYLRDVEGREKSRRQMLTFIRDCFDDPDARHVMLGWFEEDVARDAAEKDDGPTLVRLVRDAHAALDKIVETQPNNDPVVWAIVMAANEALARAEGIVREGR